jgi:hypothetical protein
MTKTYLMNSLVEKVSSLKFTHRGSTELFAILITTDAISGPGLSVREVAQNVYPRIL